MFPVVAFSSSIWVAVEHMNKQDSFTLCAGLTVWRHIYERASATQAQQGAQGQGLDMCREAGTSRMTSPFLNCLLCPRSPARQSCSGGRARARDGLAHAFCSTHHVGWGPCEHVVDDGVFDHESNLDKRRTRPREAQQALGAEQ